MNNKAQNSRRWLQNILLGGVFLIGGLAIFSSQTNAADLDDINNKVTAQDGEVLDNNQKDADYNDTSKGRVLDISGGVGIFSIVFEPTVGRTFKKFNNSNAYAEALPQSIGGIPATILDPDFFAEEKIQVIWTDLTDPQRSADQWSLFVEGNLSIPSGDGEGTIPKEYWASTVTAFTIDLDVDSDNDEGRVVNHRDEDSIEADSDKPGKIVLVNHNDDDSDNIPDYAEWSPVTPGGNRRECSLVEIVLTVPQGMDLSKQGTTITLDYDGHGSVPVNVNPIELAPSGSNYYDYRGRKLGKMRLWNIDEETSDRDADKYIVPGHPYSPDQLLTSGEGKFFIEGINLVDKSPITATLNIPGQDPATDTVNVTVVDLNMGVNNSNNSDDLLPGIPDVEWEVDEYDEIVEDQVVGNGGYPLWNAMYVGSHLELEDLEDAHPLIINMPQALIDAGYKVYVFPYGRPSNATVYLYNYVDNGGD